MPSPSSSSSNQFRASATEDEWLRCVVDYARARGWMCHHQRPARTAGGWRSAIQGDAGFPDLVLARNGRIVIAELKVESRSRGKIRPDQAQWLGALSASDPAGWTIEPIGALTGSMSLDGHVRVVVWRPSNWPTVQRVLA